MVQNDVLFSEGRIGPLKIKNRIVMEAMGNGLSELNGEVSPEDIVFYSERAKGGVGLIISEAASIHPEGRGNPRNMCIYDDRYIVSLKKLTDSIHKYECKFFVELYHPGRQGDPKLNGISSMPAPSDIQCKLVNSPVHSMTGKEVEEMIRKFIAAARRARKAGADGVLIHGAHGYLVNEFLSPYTNNRNDEYGGSEENRARFAVEIIRGIKTSLPDFPVGIRISACEYLDYAGIDRGKGITPELAARYSAAFQKAGADVIDVSSGIYETMNTAWEPVGFDEGWKTSLAEEIKKAVSVPVICTSVIRDPAFAESILEEGICDFVGSARSHLADPEWSLKAMEGRSAEIRKCISCLNCMKTLMTGTVKCAVNPAGCHEIKRGELRKDGSGRTVVVIGGGPGGMEAAVILAERGFHVILFEREKHLGGTFYLATLPPKKKKMFSLIRYLENELSRLGVEIVLGHVPTSEEIRQINAESVFVACGTDPVIPGSVPGISRNNVYTLVDVLKGKVDLKGKKVSVIGGGMSGLEVGEFLDFNGADVDIFEMGNVLAGAELFQNVMDIEKRMANVGQHTGHRLESIEDGYCIFYDSSEKRTKEVKCDAVVLAMGMKPSDFYKKIEQLEDIEIRVIASNKKFGSVAEAVEDGFLEAYYYPNRI